MKTEADHKLEASLEASIKYQNDKKIRSGLGHQLRSEERQLTECKDFLEQALLALPKGDKFIEIKRTLFDVTCQVSNEISGAQDKHEEAA